MGLKDDLQRYRKAAIDTSLFIYLMEKNPDFYDLCSIVFGKIDDEDSSFYGVTSPLTLLEVLVLPLREDNQELVEKYRLLISDTDFFQVAPITLEVIEQSAKLRAKYRSLRTPDAIQLATGIVNNADVFICNETRLKIIDEIPIIVLKEYLDEP
jgi:predicted nucleic acid-binding protein